MPSQIDLQPGSSKLQKDLDLAIKSEQLKLVLRQSSMAAVVNLVVMGLIALLLMHNRAVANYLEVWYALIAAISISRYSISRFLLRKIEQGIYLKRGVWLFHFSLVLTGLASSLILALPEYNFDHVEDLVILGLLAGMAAGSLGTIGTLQSAFLSYLFSLMLPTIVILWLKAESYPGLVVPAVGVFIASLMIAGRRLSDQLVSSVTYQFKNDNLNRTLLDAKLLAEKKNHQLHDAVSKLKEVERGTMGYAAALKRTNARLHQEINMREVNEKALADQAMLVMENEHRLRAIHDGAFDGILTLNAEGQIVSVNRAASLIFGCSVEALEQKNFHDFVPGINLADNFQAPVEIVGKTLDDKRFPLSLTIKAANLDGAAHFICTLRDETANYRARDHLIQTKESAEAANRAKSEFLSRMSHELRTPLNSILGFTQLLESDSANPLTPDQAESLEQVRLAGEHLLSLINDILDLSHIEASKITLYLESLALLPSVEEAVNLVRPQAEQNDIHIENQITSEFFVLNDHKRLRQVLLNLLSNAIKYNRPGGKVILSVADRNDQQLELKIADTGLGMSPDQVQEIFKPFTRVSENQHEVEGTGIGLSVTKELVKLMDGDIRVDSELGVGSEFVVTLLKPPDAKVA